MQCKAEIFCWTFNVLLSVYAVYCIYTLNFLERISNTDKDTCNTITQEALSDEVDPVFIHQYRTLYEYVHNTSGQYISIVHP